MIITIEPNTTSTTDPVRWGGLVIADPDDIITLCCKLSPRYAVALWEAIRAAEPANPTGVVVADFLVTIRRCLDAVRVRETR